MSTELERQSRETSVSLCISIPGDTWTLDIPCGFLRHMIHLFLFHSNIGAIIKATGDLEVDAHHLTEDIGILLGRAFLKELEGQTIHRYGWCAMPMDGSLALVAVDVSGRGQFFWDGTFPTATCGDFDLELVPEFWKAFCRESRMTIHGRLLAVDNSHHGMEALFKGIGRAMKDAVTSTDSLQSTKGILL
jgi:imidazoleglycerol-phosphate dehydratase